MPRRPRPRRATPTQPTEEARRDDWTAFRIAWRDTLLDTVVTILGRDTKNTGELSGRLANYLADARRGEVDTRDGHREELVRRLREYTAERLPELAKKRNDSLLRPYKLAWGWLEGSLKTFRDSGDRSDDEWRAFVKQLEGELADEVAAKKLPGPFRALSTAHRRNAVIFTQGARLRPPKAMAWHLLILACPPVGARNLETFRIQVESHRLRLKALK